MISATRRQFLKAGAAVLGAGLGGALPEAAPAQEPGARPPGRPAGVEVLNPRGRVPVALIVDDSTCLANLAHFAIPQFAEVFPSEYRQDWKALPREIPDAFVRRFGEWCGEHGGARLEELTTCRAGHRSAPDGTSDESGLGLETMIRR